MSASVPACFERIVASYHDGNKNRGSDPGHWDWISVDVTSNILRGNAFTGELTDDHSGELRFL